MSKCLKCKYHAIDEGFMECRWGWEHTDEAIEFLKDNNRHANGYDLALEMGKFRQCDKFKEKKNLFRRILNL